MTKEEKIKQAYGINYDNFKNVIDEQGWNQKRIFNYQDLDHKNFDYKETGHGIYISRPKSLQGIENNNGWNKISEVGYPKDESVNYHVLHIDFPEVQEISLMQEVDKRFTHWRRIETPINPIY